MKKLLLFILTLMLAACSTIQPKSDFDRAHETWVATRVSHYRFNVFVGCFCAFGEDMPLIIEVKDGQVVSMEFQSGKEIDPSLSEYFQRFATVDKLFEEIERDQNGEAEKITVEYDATYGFPTKIDIDFILQAADDELYLTISGFEVLP